MPKVAAVVSFNSFTAEVLERLQAQVHVEQVAAIVPQQEEALSNDSRIVASDSAESLETVVSVLKWFQGTGADFLLWLFSDRVEVTSTGLNRLLHTASDSRASIVYSDYFNQEIEGPASLYPLIDYQSGSLRDDFSFGELVLLDGAKLTEILPALSQQNRALRFGGWYDLRLRLSEIGAVVHLSEPTYTVVADRTDDKADSHFSYVDPRNRDYQIEMEEIATAHLRRTGAFLDTPRGALAEERSPFPVEASVVIPVRNRERTIKDAVHSALSQETDFSFNVIVVDNHSTDKTSQELRDIAEQDSRLVHVIPERRDLGIGGCWNEAVYSMSCGRYAVQLDSDDLYASNDVLQRIVDEFRRSECAMVIGSYEIVDFDLKQIPPGLIDHREWTDENGHNNALRIAGLGAPRAYHTATLREFGFPNVSYGEDYALVLRIVGKHRLGRIYDSLYLCRRWEDNSDHTLPLETVNRYAAYKDRVRSIELEARKNRQT